MRGLTVDVWAIQSVTVIRPLLLVARFQKGIYTEFSMFIDDLMMTFTNSGYLSDGNPINFLCCLMLRIGSSPQELDLR